VQYWEDKKHTGAELRQAQFKLGIYTPVLPHVEKIADIL
jgi:hypothetical protein